MGGQLLSLRAYAASRKERGLPGGSLAAVQKAIESKRISTVQDDRGRAKIDPVVADIQWMQNTDAEQSARANPDLAPAYPSGAVDRVSAPGVAPQVGSADDAKTAYAEIKMRQAVADMRQSEMKAQQMAGDLVEREEVTRAAFKAGRMLRDMLLSVPGTLAGQLAGMSDARAIEALLRGALREVLANADKLLRQEHGEEGA